VSFVSFVVQEYWRPMLLQVVANKKKARDLSLAPPELIRFERVYGSLKITVIWVSTSTGSPFR
jgi:hypothetical protein